MLSGTQTFTGATTFSSDITVNGVRVGKGLASMFGNTALGVSSLNANTTGNSNTALGYFTLSQNTTGFSNVAIGFNSMVSSNGNENTAIGNQAMQLNTNGVSNTAIGHTALQSNTTGNNNIAIGYESGINITTGSNNTIIGKYAGTAALANNIVLADGAGNIRYQWNGTNNVFGNPISGTSATFSGKVGIGATPYASTTAIIRAVSATSTNYALIIEDNASNQLFEIKNNGAATFSSSVGIQIAAGGLGGTLDVQGTNNVYNAIFKGGTTTGQSFGPYFRAGTNASDIAFQVKDVNETNTYFRIRGDGNVGIGTGSPVGKLDVTLVNTRRFIVTYDDSIITIKGASDTGAGENLRIIGDNVIFNSGSSGSGTERMRITSGGMCILVVQV